jgi:hypothetical protein
VCRNITVGLGSQIASEVNHAYVEDLVSQPFFVGELAKNLAMLTQSKLHLSLSELEDVILQGILGTDEALPADVVQPNGRHTSVIRVKFRNPNFGSLGTCTVPEVSFFVPTSKSKVFESSQANQRS